MTHPMSFMYSQNDYVGVDLGEFGALPINTLVLQQKNLGHATDDFLGIQYLDDGAMWGRCQRNSACT